jgi:hypothetical protein
MWGFLLMSFEKTTPNTKHFFNNSDYGANCGQILTRGLLVGAALPAKWNSFAEPELSDNRLTIECDPLAR